MDKNSLLIITAHPDDAELLFGGTINKYARKGNSVDILVITNGENWNRLSIEDSGKIKEIRETESREAAKVLNVNSVSFLNIDDGLVNSKELVPILVSKIRDINPNIILTHSELEGHPDHKEVSISVKRVCNQSGEPAPILNPYWKCDEKPVSDFKGLFVHHLSNESGSPLTKYISLEKKDVEKKIDAILCHKSQFVEKERIRDRVLTETHFNGLLSGVEYAEVFEYINTNLQVSTDMLID